MTTAHEAKVSTPFDVLVGKRLLGIARSPDSKFLRIKTEAEQFYFVAEAATRAWFSGLCQRGDPIGHEIVRIETPRASRGLRHWQATGEMFLPDHFMYRVHAANGAWAMVDFRNEDSDIEGTRVEPIDSTRANLAVREWMPFDLVRCE